jgi:hypothetical protein
VPADHRHPRTHDDGSLWGRGTAVTPGLRGPRAGGLVSLALVALAPLAGCVAEIKEDRVYGPPRPAVGFSVQQDRSAESSECRSIAMTPMARDVEVRRSFADTSAFGPQATNTALAFLLGAAAGFIGYDLSSLACSQNNDTGCSGQTAAGAASAETLALALAAIPVAFLVYNAVRVQDRRAVERVAPAIEVGEWGPCPK